MPFPTKAEPERVEVPTTEPLRMECEHFLHCLATGKRPRTDGAEGLRVLKVLNASQQSLDEQGTKVCLSLSAPKPSDPYFLMYPSGATVLPRLFDMRLPSGPRMIP